MGPAILLPDGRLFFIGATGHTALYTHSTVAFATRLLDRRKRPAA
jgi:hypothetical protein